jgi:hypothetical protein
LSLWWSVRDMRRSTAQAMWIGINSARPALAIFQFRRQGPWWWIWMAYNMRNLSRGFRGTGAGFPTGSPVEIIIISLGVVVMLCVAASAQFSQNKMRDRLIREMRSIAREPVPDPHDPRFKKWNFTERLPRSAYEEMAERVRVYPQRVADKEREGRS